MKEEWKYISFEKCLKKVPKQPQVKSKDYLRTGKYPIVSQEADLISGYWDDKSMVYHYEKPVVIFGDHTKNIKYIDFDFVVGADGTHILLAKDDINAKFFYYAIKSLKLRDLGYARHYKLLKEKQIPVPPLSEQQRIVVYLDSAFAKIDAIKAKAKENLDNAQALFQAALTDMMTPKDGWEEKTLGEVGNIKRGGNFSKKDFINDGHPCIHYGQIHMKFGTETYKHISSVPKDIVKPDRCAQKGDLIIAITSEDDAGSCKCTAWMGDYKVYVGAHAAIYTHNLDATFMSYYFQSPYFQKQKLQFVHGFKVVEINPKDIAKISISYPSSKSQQKQIAEKLNSVYYNLKQMQQNFEAICSECDTLKQSLLRQVFE